MTNVTRPTLPPVATMLKSTALAAFCLLSSTVHAQARMQAMQGEPLPLVAGQVAILQQQGAEIVVAGVVVDGDGPRVDVQRGDRLRRFQQSTASDLVAVMQAFKALPVGAMVTLELQRDARTVSVRLPRAEAPAGPMMIVGDGTSGGAGAWTSSGGSSKGFGIAGAQIIENEEGMPEVTHRAAHPASTTVSLRAGDVITAIDGRPIAALAGLEMLYGRVPAGTTVTLTVKRGKEQVSVAFAKPAS